MLKGMKAKRQLAVFVALTVGGAFSVAPAAYAAETTVGTNDTRLTGAGTPASPYQGISGSTLLNSMTGNTLTVGTAGTTNLPVVGGTISAGGSDTTTDAVTGNTLVINNVLLTGNAYGGIGRGTVINNKVEMRGGIVNGEIHGGHAENIVQQPGAAQTATNSISMSGGTVNGALHGAHSTAGGATTGAVTLSGGTVTAGADGIAIAGGKGVTSAINNSVSITGGTVTDGVYGGYAVNAGAKTTGNSIALGDTSGNYNADLSGASLYGGNDGDYTNNHLYVRAKNIRADSAKNFATYDFQLNTGVAAGDTMLTLTNNNDALGRAVNLSEITLNAEGWSGKDKKTYYGVVGTVTLLADGNPAGNRGSNLNLTGAAHTGVSGDYEYRIRSDAETTYDSPATPLTSTTTTRNYGRAELHRYRNADATYDDGTNANNGTIYGGYSAWENVAVQDNTLTIANAAGTMTAYGGKTTTGANAVHNNLNMTGGTVKALYGAEAEGSGRVENNHVSLTRATSAIETSVSERIIGGRSLGTGVVRQNTVTVNNATVSGEITGGSGTTTVEENTVTIQGNVVDNTVHSVVGGRILGAYITGDNSVSRSASKNTVTITEGAIQETVYGVFGEFFNTGGSSTTTYTPTVQYNTVAISGGSVNNDVYGAKLSDIGTATKNSVAISGTARVGGKVYGAGTEGSATLEENSVTVSGGSVNDVYGASTTGSGTVTHNIVTISDGLVHDDVIGAVSSSTGAVTANHVTISGGIVRDKVTGGESTSTAVNAGAVTGNTVTVAGGVIYGNVYGGETNAAAPPPSSTTITASGGNIVTITGGRIGGVQENGTEVDRRIYGGYAHGSHRTVEMNNIVNLGSADGNYSADLTHVDVYGGNSEYTGNTLNVRAKDITVKGVHNFANYKFFLTDKVNAGNTMLTLTDTNGFDNHYSGTAHVDFTNVDIDTTNMSNRQIEGTVTLIDGTRTNGLEFANYNPHGANASTATNGNYEYALRTDTDRASGTKVLLDYNIFKNGNEAYASTNEKDQWYGGISYGGHTTENNTLTINAPLSRNIAAYGGRTLGLTVGTEGGSTGNTLVIRSTGDADNAYQVTTAYGGYIGRTSDADATTNSSAVTKNTLRMEGGKAGTLYGGYTRGTGTATENNVYVTGGTVSGDIYAGYAATAGNATNNTLMLGADDGSYDATIAGELYGSNNSGDAGNTLVVQAGKEIAVKKIHNFDTYKFVLHNDALVGKTMLSLTDAGALGDMIDMEKVTVDAARLTLNQTLQGTHDITLIRNNGTITFANAADAEKMDRTSAYETSPYEVYLHTESDALKLRMNRLRDGDRSFEATDETAVGQDVFTGISAMGHDVTNNHLRVTGATTGTHRLNDAAAGVTTGEKGSLKNNTLTIDSANALTITNVYGAYAMSTGSSGGSSSGGSGGSGESGSSSDLTGNSVTLLRGDLSGNIYGARSNGKGKADSNTVTLRSGSVAGNVYGAYTADDEAANNTVDLFAVRIRGDVIGAQGKEAKTNTINLRGTTVDGTIYGGRINDGTNPAPTAALADGNTLNIYDMGASASTFEGIRNINFYLSPRADIARSMLTLTRNTGKDLSGTDMTMNLDGSYAPLGMGDVVKLITLPEAQSLTTDDLSGKTYKTTQGVTLDYTFGLETRSTAGSTKNELIARVIDMTVKEQSKSLVETQAASIALLASGSDLLTDVGIPAAEMAAMQIADIVDAPSASDSEGSSAAVTTPLSSLGSYQMFAAQSFGSMRLKSGSHVDTKGWGLNVGYARRSELVSGALTFGPFIEYGRGSYDSYLDDGTHGDGKTNYLGIGVMAKMEKDTGLYYEGSLRVGRAKSDYSGNIDGRPTSYDGSSNYVAGHLGIGQKKEFDSGNKFETYAKYFYAHQAGMSVKLSSGEPYDFGASTSSRIRFGTRYTFKNDMDGELYAGLAWEYEFDGKGTASYEGYNLPSTSLKGSTTLFELGYRFAPADSTVSYGVNLTGFKGKRKGVTGGFNIAWAF